MTENTQTEVKEPTAPTKDWTPTPTSKEAQNAKRRRDAVMIEHKLAGDEKSFEELKRETVTVDTSQKLKRDKHGRFIKGTGVPAGLAVNPQNRSAGGWTNKNMISYWYKYFMKMTTAQARRWLSKIPEDQRTVAQEIAFARITDARKSGKIGLNTTQEITDRTEGKAPQFVNTSITTSSIESLNLTNEELAQIAFNDVDED
jgi:hypothetical protein